MFCSTTLAIMSFMGLAEPAAATGLSAHVGHYPFEEIGCVSFFDEPLVARAVTAAAGGEALDFIASLDAAPLVVRQEDALVAIACSDGDCDNANAALAITPLGRLIALCLYAKDGGHGGKPGEMRWIGESLARTLPAARSRACPHDPEQFLEAYAQARS